MPSRRREKRNNVAGEMRLPFRRAKMKVPRATLLVTAGISSRAAPSAQITNVQRAFSVKWDVAEPWREGAPKDAHYQGAMVDGKFHDQDLNALETQALSANQTLKVPWLRLEQARATAAIQVATPFPTLSTSPGVTRQRLSGNRPTSGVRHHAKAHTQNAFFRAVHGQL